MGVNISRNFSVIIDNLLFLPDCVVKINCSEFVVHIMGTYTVHARAHTPTMKLKSVSL